jgi:D-alanyl-D-alanine carboxypeptidase
MEINSGAVLYEKNSDEVNYPASITKVMTTMLALEHCSLDEVVTFSDDAINLNQGSTSHIARDYGEEMTMEQCLYGVMLESANECSYAVAEHVGEKLGGDYRTFIDLMNEKAKSLGCTNTHFNNSNGLPDPDHWTSAHDMALISAEAYKNENFRIIVGTRSYKIPPTNKHEDITPLNNHHAMISNYKTRKYLYEYCTGGKTGYTQAAGSTLVTFAEKDGLALVCVVMRTNGSDQYIETTGLMEHCFQNFQKVDIGDNGSVEDGQEENTGFMASYMPFVKLDENAQIVFPEKIRVIREVTGDESFLNASLAKI